MLEAQQAGVEGRQQQRQAAGVVQDDGAEVADLRAHQQPAGPPARVSNRVRECEVLLARMARLQQEGAQLCAHLEPQVGNSLTEAKTVHFVLLSKL